MPSRRRLARITVMQTIFEGDFRDHRDQENLQNILQRNLRELEEPIDAEFAKALLAGVLEHWDDIQHAMQDHAPQWPLERMDRMTRAILMIGTEELLFRADAPPAVIMNEAIDIAKEYGGEESGKFVNGVLNAIAHS